MGKAEYVVGEARKGHTGNHHCHWPGCTRSVPPAMWGCKRHWFTLPQELRNKVWRTFRPGQEIAKNPSRAYIDVANEVQVWIREHYPNG